MDEIKNKMPGLPYWILKKCVFGMKEGYAGDIEEEFEERIWQEGKRKAIVWIWFHAMVAVPKTFKIYFTWSFIMMNNYLKIALRHIRKYKLYAVLNITGLAVGFTCALLIFLYVRYELSYDRYHEHRDTIYRVVQKQVGNVWLGTDLWNATCGLLKPTLLEHVPEVLKATRVYHRVGTVHHRGNHFVERRFFIVEPEFLEIFTFPLIKGNPKTALSNPSSVLLTEEMAAKYFGNEDPMGTNLRIGEIDYVVTGVLKNVPSHSHFTFDFLASFETLYATSLMRNDQINRWGNNHYSTYIQTREDVNPKMLEQQITEVVQKLRDRRRQNAYHLQKVPDIHLHSHVNREFEPNSDIKYIYIFSAIGIFLMLIVSFNYMNLSTAQAFYRAREVGVRKVNGANRRQIALQSVGESILFSMLGLVLSVVLVMLFLPSFSNLVDRNFNLNLINGLEIAGAFIILSLVIGLISGSYPALILSRLSPINGLKGTRMSTATKKIGFRNTLVVIQFFISIAMMVSTIVLYKQLHFIKYRDLGFQKENIVHIYAYDPEFRGKYETFRNELLQHPGMSGVTYTSSTLAYNMGGGGAWWEGKQEDEDINFYRLAVDYNFFEFFQIHLLKGRAFLPEMTTDIGQAYILNETAVNIIGWQDPLGKAFNQWAEEEGQVIGIVDDFHFQSLRLQIEPLIITLGRETNDRRYFSIKVRSDDIPGTLDFIEKQYKNFSPGYPFNLTFLDERLDQLYQTDQKMGTIFTYFTTIAIVIATLGLFGLGSFTAEKRTKEIGVRKVLGASTWSVVFMLSAEFIKWVSLAALVAIPISYYAMHEWLENFAYRTRMGIEVFALATLLALIIAVLSVSYQSFKAANANPVESLRYE